MAKLAISKEELDNLELSGLSEQQIADKLGITRQWLYKYRKANGYQQIVRSDKGIERTTLEQKLISRRKAQNKYRLANPDKARDYRALNKIFIETVGRPRKKGEVIHHIDNDPQNNSRDNLVICTQSYHINTFHKR